MCERKLDVTDTRCATPLSSRSFSLSAFTQGHDHPPLVGPILQQTSIHAVGLHIRRPDMATEEGTIHLDRVAELYISGFRTQRLTELRVSTKAAIYCTSK